MQQNYSQLRALLAITKASLIATVKHPQSVFFSLFFPVVLIVIFGSLSGRGTASVSVAFEQGADSSHALYRKLANHPLLRFSTATAADVEDQLKKGRLAAVISIRKPKDAQSNALYDIHLRSSTASQKDVPLLQSILRDFIHQEEKKVYAGRETLALISAETIAGRRYKTIDFMLPGMIGFSLIGAAIFGVAFAFYSFRETLVLKRLYSTPISRMNIILGESLSRVLFQLSTVVALIAFGYFVYDFTLADGWLTVLNLLIISFVGLVVFLGFGFFISGISRTQTLIPIYANIFMFPQYFLSGTFFPKTSLPESVQAVVDFLPLTAVNDAMRNIAFEGAGLLSCSYQLIILGAWAVVVYLLATRFFKWES